MSIRLLSLLLTVLLLGAGCSPLPVTAGKTYSLPAGQEFRPGPAGGVDLVWSTAGIRDFQSLRETLQGYDRLMPGRTWLVIDRPPAAAVDEEPLLQFSGRMMQAIGTRLGGFKLAAVPRPDALQLQIALTCPTGTTPFFTLDNRLLTDRSGAGPLTRIEPGDRPCAGLAAELLVSDAMSDRPLLAFVDRRFSADNLQTLSASPDLAAEVVNRWLERLLMTLSYWNWIQG